PGQTKRRLIHRLARADAEDYPTWRQAAQCRKSLGHHTWVIAQRWGQHAGTQLNPLGACGCGTEPRQGRRRMATMVPPWLQVVTDEHRVKARILGPDREVKELLRTKLFGRGLISKLEHCVLSWSTSGAVSRCAPWWRKHCERFHPPVRAPALGPARFRPQRAGTDRRGLARVLG